MDRRYVGAGRLALVVDDHDDFREAMWHLLESLGFRVILAGNGVEALDKLELNDVSLIIADLWMPRMDGLEFLMRLGQATKPLPPVIAVTGDTHLATDVVGRTAAALGARAVLIKPFSQDQFAAAISVIDQNDQAHRGAQQAG